MTKPSDSIFLPAADVQPYLEKNSITFTTLDNGIKIISATKENPESVHADVHFNYSTGAYFDPPEKKGLHHLLEHLINFPIKMAAQAMDVGLNASTSFGEVRELSGGPVSATADDYGLLPFLSSIYTRLLNPLENQGKLSEIIAMEKRVVQTEIDEYAASHNWHVNRLLMHDLLEPENPLLTELPGNSQTLATITESDLRALVPKLFSSNLLTITIGNEGKKQITSQIIKEITSLFNSYPTDKDAKRYNNWELLDTTKDKKPGGTVYHKTNLRNGLTSIQFTWVFETEEFTTSEFTLKRYTAFISDKVLRYARQRGIAYYAGVHTQYGNTKRFTTARFDVSNKTKLQLEELINTINSDLRTVFSLHPDELNTMVRLEKRRQETLPLSTELKLDLILFGLQRYDKCIDAEKVKEGYKAIKSDHIQHWEQSFISTPPFVTVVGDYKE